MFHCIHAKKVRWFLLLDAVLVLLWVLWPAAGREQACSGMAASDGEGVFLPVIMYHSIVEDGTGDYQLSPAVLEEDLRYLKSHGYETVSVAALYAYTAGTGELPEHPVLLTFDDGFYNNLSAALPLLERYDMCAVVSIVGRYTEEIAAADPHAERYSYLTWEDVQALQSSGRVEIGSHTWDLHSNAERAGCAIRFGEDAQDYAAMLRSDLAQLQERMQEKTGDAPTIFAYPYGFVCRESVPVLKELGFTCTLTCYEKPNLITRDPDCLFGLYRYNRTPSCSTEAFFEGILTQ